MRHPVAYFSSVASCVAVDTELAKHVDGLTRFARDTHGRVVALLGPPSPLTRPVHDIVCQDNADILLEPSHFVDLLFENPQLRIQKLLSHAAQAVAANALAETVRRL